MLLFPLLCLLAPTVFATGIGISSFQPGTQLRPTDTIATNRALKTYSRDKSTTSNNLAKPRALEDSQYKTPQVEASTSDAEFGPIRPNASDRSTGFTRLSVPACSSADSIVAGGDDPVVVDAKSYASFSAAISSIGATPTTLNISSALSVTSNLTVPSTVTLQFVGVGRLTIQTGVTLTIAGHVIAEPSQIFANATAGQGTVSLNGNTSTRFLFPEWWGVSGSDWSPAFQQAFNNARGRTVVMQKTTYALLSTVTFNSTQDGAGLPKMGFNLIGGGSLATIIDNRVANGPAFRLYGNVTNAPNPDLGLDFNTTLSDFKIITTTSPAASNGIELSSQFYTNIKRVWIQGLTGDGIQLNNNQNALDDYNSIPHFAIEHCTILNNTGHGIRVQLSNNFLAVGLGRISYNYIRGNGQAGIKSGGTNYTIEGNSIALNLGGGVLVPATSYFNNINIVRNEFESNTGFNISIARLQSGLITDNALNASLVVSGVNITTSNIILGDDAGGASPAYHADRLQIRGNRFRALAGRGSIGIDLKQNARWVEIGQNSWLGYDFHPAGITGTVSSSAASNAVTGSGTAFLTQAPSSAWIRINGQTRKISSPSTNTALTTTSKFTYASSGITAYVTPNLRIQDTGIGNQVRDDAEEKVLGLKWFSTTVPTTGLTTPIDLQNGLFQRIVYNAGGAQTIAGPAVNGANASAPILLLQVSNNTDNTLVISFDAAFSIQNFVTPPSGQNTRAFFIYDGGASTTWVQVGPWINSDESTRVAGAFIRTQGTPSTPTTATTLTVAQLLDGILTATPTATGATVAYTLPTGTNMSGGRAFANNDSFDWSITNLATGAADTITITANTGHTIVGNPIIQSARATTGAITSNSAMFRSRRISATVWVTYRLS